MVCARLAPIFAAKKLVGMSSNTATIDTKPIEYGGSPLLSHPAAM